MIKILKAFDAIQFNEKKHTYILDGKLLKPVTSMVASLKQPFDKEYWSKKKAEEEGITQWEMLDAWKQKGIEAMKKGSEVHAYIDKRLHNNYPLVPPHDETQAFEDFWAREHINLLVMGTEFKVGDSALGLGGTVDVMFERMPFGYILGDWKTGKLKMENPFQKMKSPFNDLDDCQYHHYSLQLSAYKLILRRNTGIDISDMVIIHLDGDGQWHKYFAQDFSDRLEDWLL